MSDSKKGVFSTQEVEVTSASDVKNILNQLIKMVLKILTQDL